MDLFSLIGINLADWQEVPERHSSHFYNQATILASSIHYAPTPWEVIDPLRLFKAAPNVLCMTWKYVKVLQ